MQDPYVRPFPKVIRIEPAGACNLACSHCPTGTIAMARGVMPWNTFEIILKDIKTHLDRVKVVVLYHGGEPLLNKHFGRMVKEIKALNIPFVKTVSNGMLVSEKTLEEVVIHGLDAIEFSLDGESKAQNDFIRRNCDFDVVVANIKRLIRYKREHQSETPKIYISTTQFLSPETYYEGQEAQPPGYLRQALSGEDGSEIAFKATFAMRWPHMTVEEDVYEVFYDPFDLEDADFCDHVESTMTIRWNGEVVPCCFDLTSQYRTGNIHENDLTTIWNGERYRALRKSIAEKKYEPICANCNVVRPNAYLILKPHIALSSIQ